MQPDIARGRGLAELLQAEDFEPYVGRIFRFHGTRHALPLDRIEKGEGFTVPGAPRRPFILIFRGPKDPDYLPPGIYQAEVEGGPAYELYVEPIHTPQPDRQEYQAAFN